MKLIEVIKEILQHKIKIRNCLHHLCEKNFRKECFKKENGKRTFLKKKIIQCNKDNGLFSFNCENLKKIINQWRFFRHLLLGEKGEGSKIFPYISANGKYGFLSIAGLLNLQQNNKRSKK